jgi:hypothetical protein
MGLKEMIAELRRHADGRVSVHCITAAAEALALVTWAEEVGAMVQTVRGGWMCSVVKRDRILDEGRPTLLGAIRAAKEAYEAN